MEEEELEECFICMDCIGDEHVKQKINQNSNRETCNYCKKVGFSSSLEEISGWVQLAIEQHYSRTSDQPDDYELMLLKDRESNYVWKRSGEPIGSVISELLECEESIAEDIRVFLQEANSDREMAEMGEEEPFDEDTHYEKKAPDGAEFSSKWSAFEWKIKTGSRFFSKQAEEILGTIFNDINSLQNRSGKSVITLAGPSKEYNEIFRARVTHSQEVLERVLKYPVKELGPPPYKLAKAGRMNPQGIAVFYGALEKETAIAEVRPPIGASVVVGKFFLKKDIRLLDVEALREIYFSGSVFDPEYVNRLERTEFLKHLNDRISAPVMPDDEPFEYLATQAIAEYLSEKIDPHLDGMIYRSTQRNDEGRNIVLFHHASAVEPRNLPDGTKSSVSWGSGPPDDVSIDYTVFEETPLTSKKVPKPQNKFYIPDFDLLDDFGQIDNETRPHTLQLNLENLFVYHLKGIAYDMSDYKVKRYTKDKSDNHDF